MARYKKWTDDDLRRAVAYHLAKLQAMLDGGGYTFSADVAADHIAFLSTCPAVPEFTAWLAANTTTKGRETMHAALRMAAHRERHA